MKARFRVQARNDLSDGEWIDVYCACSRNKAENILRQCLARHEVIYPKEYRIVDAEGREV